MAEHDKQSVAPSRREWLSWKTWHSALKAHYSVPLEIPFRQFRNGSIYFVVGFIIIYMASRTLEPSVKQELIVLAGLIIGGTGFVMAMLAQVRMIISRVLAFLNKK